MKRRRRRRTRTSRPYESTERFLNDCNTFMRSTMQKFRIQKDQAATLVLLNWAAPSTVRNSVLAAAQTGFASQLIIIQPHAVGACLLPAFSYKSGILWLLESNQLQPLAHAGLDVDSSWMLAFTRRCHAREGRPRTMPGKVMLAHSFDKNSMWFQSGLLRYGRTNEVEMMP